MSRTRPYRHAVPWVKNLSAGLLAGALAASSCTGVESDVLAPRSAADLGLADGMRSMDTDGPASGCIEEMLRMPSCTEVSVWWQIAKDHCFMYGLLPGTIQVQDPCATMGGMMGSQGVSFTCCSSVPPPPMCELRSQGDGMSCRDAKYWLDSAAVDCQARDERAVMPVLDGPCAPQRYLLVKYACCTDPGAPRPMNP